MGWFDHGGSRIYYEDHGSGEPVLLLPGWAGRIEEFSSLRRALMPNYRVIAADLPGSGQSGPQPRQYVSTYFDDDARSFLALLDELATGPAHLIGFSDSGEDALLMAILRPDMARSVITWGAAGRLIAEPEMLDAFYNLIDNPIEPLKGFGEHLKGAYGEANARAMAQSVSTAWRAMVQAGGDISRSRAAEISCPALLITGERDFFAPPPLVSELACAIRGGEFMELKGAGHDVHAARPEWLAHSIIDWLSKRA